MQVENGLSAMGASVDNQAVAALLDVFLFCDFARCKEEISQGELILRIGLVDRLDVPVGNDQNMSWRNRVDVAEGGYKLILVKDAGFGLTGNNFAKKAGSVHRFAGVKIT